MEILIEAFLIIIVTLSFVLVSLTSEKQDLQSPQCTLCEKFFSNVNLKQSKFQEHFGNRHGGVDVVGHSENLCELKEPVLIKIVGGCEARTKLFYGCRSEKGWEPLNYRIQ